MPAIKRWARGLSFIFSACNDPYEEGDYCFEGEHEPEDYDKRNLPCAKTEACVIIGVVVHVKTTTSILATVPSTFSPQSLRNEAGLVT